MGLDRLRGSKPRSPGRLPSSHAGRSVLGSHRPSSARAARASGHCVRDWDKAVAADRVRDRQFRQMGPLTLRALAAASAGRLAAGDRRLGDRLLQLLPIAHTRSYRDCERARAADARICMKDSTLLHALATSLQPAEGLHLLESLLRRPLDCRSGGSRPLDLLLGLQPRAPRSGCDPNKSEDKRSGSAYSHEHASNGADP